MPLHVYGVVRSQHPLPEGLTGVGDPPGTVRLVPGELSARAGLAAVVSVVRDDRELSAEDAVSHLDLLTALLNEGPVMPVLFGTVLPDEDSVSRELLEPRRDWLIKRLDALDGMVELRLTIVPVGDYETRAVVRDHPELTAWAQRPAGMSGAEWAADRIRLGQVVSTLVEEKRSRVAELFSERLGPLSVACTPPRLGDDGAVHQEFLVRAESVAEFDKAVPAVNDQLAGGYRSSVIGPLPVFDFTDLDLGEPEKPDDRWGW